MRKQKLSRGKVKRKAESNVDLYLGCLFSSDFFTDWRFWCNSNSTKEKQRKKTGNKLGLQVVAGVDEEKFEEKGRWRCEGEMKGVKETI